MPSLLPSGPREPAYLARRQRLGVLPTLAFWGEGLAGGFVGFGVAVGRIAGGAALPWGLLGGLTAALLLGLVERGARRRAGAPARPEAVGPEARPRQEMSPGTDRSGPGAGA